MSRSASCPRCGKPVVKTGSVWQCSSNKSVRDDAGAWKLGEGCGYKIFSEKFGKKLTGSMVRRTLEGKRPKVSGPEVEGPGPEFDARLVPDRQTGSDSCPFDDLNRKRSKRIPFTAALTSARQRAVIRKGDALTECPMRRESPE